MEIPSDRDTSVKVAEKLSKSKNLEIEITKMWGLKTITVPVVIGAVGVVTKGNEKHTDKIPGKIKHHRTLRDRPTRIKPHPLKSSIDRMKTMITHNRPRPWIGSGTNSEHDRRIKKIERIIELRYV